jgi:hypothetical protein
MAVLRAIKKHIISFKVNHDRSMRADPNPAPVYIMSFSVDDCAPEDDAATDNV